jgi:hypothetical protein
MPALHCSITKAGVLMIKRGAPKIGNRNPLSAWGI